VGGGARPKNFDYKMVRGVNGGGGTGTKKDRKGDHMYKKTRRTRGERVVATRRGFQKTYESPWQRKKDGGHIEKIFLSVAGERAKKVFGLK